jgi:hypothetical protein
MQASLRRDASGCFAEFVPHARLIEARRLAAKEDRMSRNMTAGLMALALSAILAAGSALWLGTRPLAPAALSVPRPDMDAAMVLLRRAQAGDVGALPELRVRMEALAEAQDRAGNPLRLEAMLQGLAGRIEGTVATLEGAPVNPGGQRAVQFSALVVGALGLIGLLLTVRRFSIWTPVTSEEAPAWGEALRAEVQNALGLAQQAEEAAARAATRTAEQQERLFQRVRLMDEKLEAMPNPADSAPDAARLPALLDQMEAAMAGLGDVATRAEAAGDRHTLGLDRMEEVMAGIVRRLHEVPQDDAALDRIIAVLPALEAAVGDVRTTAPLLGELAILAQQAMTRVTDEAVVRIGVAAERMTDAGHAALAEAQGGLRDTLAKLDGSLVPSRLAARTVEPDAPPLEAHREPLPVAVPPLARADVAQLVDEAEGLAEQVAQCVEEGLRQPVGGRADGVLSSIQATIDRLQAVAAALAIAADTQDSAAA